MRRCTLLAVLLIAGAMSAGASGAGYPVSLPDFAHPGSPHAPLLSPTSGDNDRPMLVVFGLFSDVPSTPGVTAGTIANEFFGAGPGVGLGTGSVADFFRVSSFGKLLLTPAQETAGPANDGVVTADLGTIAAFNALSDQARGRKVVEAADPWVDYGVFDRNGDERIRDDELLVVLIQEARPVAPNPDGTGGDTNDCGATRSIVSGSASTTWISATRRPGPEARPSRTRSRWCTRSATRRSITTITGMPRGRWTSRDQPAPVGPPTTTSSTTTPGTSSTSAGCGPRS